MPGYEILRELGRGGMGVVYQARHTKLHRVVALKMILAGSHAGAADLARFQTEAEAIARLRHANIVQVYEVSEHEGKPFFSLEFCGGGSLEKKLNGTPLPAREAAALVETLARAMQAAHEQHVIHRDLKPANVLLAEDGTPKITDFGLAKKLDEAGQTASGAIMGTPSYMAPEQAGGKSGEIGPAADVYALGAILYECLTGRPPFKAATALDTVLQVVSDEPAAPSQLQTKTPRDLETICLKCLHKEPVKRYATARELADDLRRFLDGEPILARPSSGWERALKWAKRRPAAAALLAVSSLAAALLLGGLLVSNRLIADREEKARQALVDRTAALDDLRTEQQKTTAAFKRETDERLKAERLLVENYVDRGLALCEQGEVYTGLLWLGRGLERAPRDAKDLQRIIRINLSAWSQHLTQLWSAIDCQKRDESIALSPDGTKIAAWAGKDVLLWDATTGVTIGKPLRHSEEAKFRNTTVFLNFSPDGKILLTGSLAGIWRWDTVEGKCIGEPIYPNGCAGAFSADGKTILAITGVGPFFVQRWDAVTGEPVSTPVPLGKPMGKWNILSRKGYAISPDLKTVLISYGDVAWIVDSSTGKRIGDPLQHDTLIIDYAAFSPDGKTVVTSAGRIAQLWDATTGKPKGNAFRHDQSVSVVAFNPDGSRILTGCNDGSAWFWDVATGKALGERLQHRDDVWALAFSGDGRRILTASSTEARIWEVARPEVSGVPLPHRAPIHAVDFSPDGKRLLTGSGDTGETGTGEARLWDATSGSAIGEPMPHKRAVFAVAFSSDGKTLLTRMQKGKWAVEGESIARLWDAATGKPIGEPIQPPHLHEAIFSPKGTTVLTRSDGRFRLWNPVTGKLIMEQDDVSSVHTAAFSPDEKVIVTAGATLEKPRNFLKYYDLRLWDATTGTPIGQPVKLQEGVGISGSEHSWQVAFNPGGTQILTGSRDKTARLWNATTLEPIDSPLSHEGEVNQVAFSRDGKVILTVSGKIVRLWVATTQAPMGLPLEHRSPVEEAAFSPDGAIVATRSAGGATRLWDVATNQPIGSTIDSVTALAFVPDGQKMAIASDKTARIWKLPTPLAGDPEQVALWTQVITGMELDDRRAVHALDAKTWRERRERLEKLGGFPMP